MKSVSWVGILTVKSVSWVGILIHVLKIAESEIHWSPHPDHKSSCAKTRPPPLILIFNTCPWWNNSKMIRKICFTMQNLLLFLTCWRNLKPIVIKSTWYVCITSYLALSANPVVYIKCQTIWLVYVMIEIWLVTSPCRITWTMCVLSVLVMRWLFLIWTAHQPPLSSRVTIHWFTSIVELKCHQILLSISFFLLLILNKFSNDICLALHIWAVITS